jgi:hypothetical protein
MTEREKLTRALWCAATAAGGTLRIGPSVVKDYPADGWVSITRDKTFGDLVVSAHALTAGHRE